MNRTVWKHRLSPGWMDIPGRPLLFGAQGGDLFVWCESPPPGPSIRVRVFGTGHPLDDAAVVHLGSCQDGPYVWHLYGEADNGG